MVIGYRPPHKGREAIEKLKADYDAYLKELDLLEVQRLRERIEANTIDYAIPAIRAWNIAPSGLLRSLAFSCEWESPVQREEYRPFFHGTSGFWAVKPSAIPIIDSYHPQVVGTVELSGTVIEHELGWRAEICTLRALYILPYLSKELYYNSVAKQVQSRPHADQAFLERTYQCDVHYLESIYQVTGRLLK